MGLWLGLTLLAVGAFLSFDLYKSRDRLVSWTAEIRADQADGSRVARWFIPDPEEDRLAVELTYRVIGGGALVVGVVLVWLGLFG